MLVVILENESKADEGKTMLLQLDSEGRIGIYGYAVVAKNADGIAVVKQADGHGTLSPFGRTFLESLSDATGGALGAAQQASDFAADSSEAKTRKDFIREAKEVLLPHRVAIVAEVEEELPTVVDSRMESIGGIVFRWTVSEVKHAVEM
jgi:uncharacterized membrane protein